MQVIPLFAMGGGEVMCEKLLHELKKMGHDVFAVSMYNYKSAITERLENNGIRVEYLDKKSGLDIKIFWKFYKLLKKEKPDVVHNHLYSFKYVMPGAVFCRVRARIHTVHSVAGKEAGTFSRKIQKMFFKQFKVVPVGLTMLIKDSVVEEYKISKEKVPFVLNGMPVDDYIKKTDYSSVKSILHVGRFQNVKNHKGLISAFEIIHKKHPEI